jgi:glycosyltransferase involved in cell wall biosynthesis
MPEISVIVPSYNHARFLTQRLDSILQQTFIDFELIILDDASTDESKAIIEKFRSHPKVASIVLNEINSESTFAQWKKGLSLANGKYIWIAESDDSCTANFLEVAVKELENGSDLFYCRNVNVDAEGHPRQNQNRWYEDLDKLRWKADFRATARNEMENYLAFKNVINNASAVVFRKEAWQTDILSELTDMKFCGDWIFWWLCLSRWKQVSYSVEATNYFRFHSATSRVSSRFTRNPEIHRVLKLILATISDERQKEKIAAYFFRNHYGIFPRRMIKNNLNLRREQLQIHQAFRKCWRDYYLGR